MVVEDGRVEDRNLQIALSEAHEIDPDCEVGEEVTDEVHFADFGRRAILNLRQTLSSKIVELQKDNLFAKYKGLIGHIVTADVYQVWKKEVLLLDDHGNELLLLKNEQIPNDFFTKGQSMRAVVQRVENENNRAKIYLSRTDNVFLQRLFELEVPEINDGLITIKAIARIPGERAKIAVESFDDRIDPVGACVGMKGSRIRGIVRELRNENIDVVNYSTNTKLFIQRSLSPAKISSIHLYENEHKAEVSLREEEVSLAIGKGGSNIKLACMLTDYTIDVFREFDGAAEEEEEDVYLDRFDDEIDVWVIEALKNIGCNTAKSVLALTREELIERADLEEQTVDEVFRILQSEFEEDAPEEAVESEENDPASTDETEHVVGDTETVGDPEPVIEPDAEDIPDSEAESAIVEPEENAPISTDETENAVADPETVEDSDTEEIPDATSERATDEPEKIETPTTGEQE